MSEPRAGHLGRRPFIRAGLASLAGLPLSATGLPAHTAEPARGPFVYKFRIGDIDAWSISDGYMLFREPLGLMWPEEDRPEMREWLEEHGEPLERVTLYVNVLVIRLGNEVVLFDAGFGPRPSPERGWLGEGLRQIGITPDQVTAGFLSHAHGDHLGGFVVDGRPAFPNAAFHVLPAEFAFWHAKEPDFSRSKRDRKPLPGMIRQVRAAFQALEDVHQPVKPGSSLFGGAVTVEAAPGHTAGHAVFRIRSGGESLLHLSDVVHHHGLMFHDPEWTIAFDHDPLQAVETRRGIFARAAAERERCYAFHLPWPGVGRVVRSGAGYAWHPESWSWSG